MDILKHKLQQLLDRANVSDQFDVIWPVLKTHYTESHRAYHNLKHIEAMFGQLSVIETKIKDIDTVSWAIFYHDIIYKATIGAKNELKSAEKAAVDLQHLGLTQKKIEKVMEMILSTEHHLPIPPNTNDSDFLYFLDIDLSILGQSEELYKLYTQSIRNEYNFIPMNIYKAGRKKILQQFLKRPQLYYTTYFQDLLEEQARKNINKELEIL